MSMADETRRIAEVVLNGDETLTPHHVVEACRDKKSYPELHQFIWGEDVETLLYEARIARARSVIMRLRISTIEGEKVRYLMHVRDVPGYLETETIVTSFDLAPVKLGEFVRDLRGAQKRLSVFRQMLSPEVAAEIDEMVERTAKVAEEAIDRYKKSPAA